MTGGNGNSSWKILMLLVSTENSGNFSNFIFSLHNLVLKT